MMRSKIISNKKLLRLLSVAAFAVVGLLPLVGVKSVYAEAAQCFVVTGTTAESYRSEPCDSSIMNLAFYVSHDTPQENKCYMVDAPDSVGPYALLSITETSDQGAEPCLTWSGQATQAASEPPVCKKYEGTASDYGNMTADITKLSDIPCDELEQLLRDSNNVTDISEPGMCYIGVQNEFAEGKWGVYFDTCWSILAHFAAADEARQAALNSSITSAQRDDNIKCPDSVPPDECTDYLLSKNSIVSLMKRAIQFFTVVVGVIITAVIVWAGIEYSSAGGDANKTAVAKNRIRNAIIALVAYIFLGVGLSWLVPGGIF